MLTRPAVEIVSDADTLVERAELLGFVDHLFDNLVRGESRVVVIEGGLGTGKSALLREISRRTGPKVTPLVARCAPDEADEELGAVRQLLEPLVNSAYAGRPDGGDLDWLRNLDQGWFDQVVSAQGDDVRALYWLTVQIAIRKPLALIIDDVQWIDERSLDFLAYLLRRLHQMSILLVVGLDQREPSPRWPRLALMVRDPSAVLWHLPPLSAEGVRTLCERTLHTADQDLVRACRELTGGVPLLVTELLAEAGRSHQVDGDGGSDTLIDALHRCAVPTVAAAALGRARRHGAGVVDVLNLLSVIERPLTMRFVAHAVDHPQSEAADAVETLRRLSLVSVDERIMIDPPLVRVAVQRALSPSERHDAQARVARAVAAADGGQSEAAARYLMDAYPAGAPEPDAVPRAAAAGAYPGGRAEGEGGFLRRVPHEPAPAGALAAPPDDLGAAELRHHGPQGVRQLRSALQAATEPVQRAGVALRLAHALQLADDIGEATATLERELEATGLPEEHDLVLRMRAEMLFMSLGDDAVHRRILDRYGMPAASRAALVAGNRPGTRVALAVRALHDALAARPAGPVLDDMSTALNGWLEAGGDCSIGLLLGGLVLIWADDLDAAEQFLAEAHVESLNRGSVLCASLTAWMHGMVETRRGRLGAAERLISQAGELVDDRRWRRWRLVPLLAAAELAPECGTTAELLAHAVREGLAGDLPHLLLAHTGLASRGRLRVISGDVRRGLDDLRETGRRLVDLGCLNPAVAPWRSEAAMALRRLGQIDEAYPLADEEVRLACQWASPRPLAIALRRRGLLRPEQDGLADLTESLRLLDGCGMPLEKARTLLALGHSHRLRGALPQARSLLAEARALALTSGAQGLLDRVNEELVTARGRPRLRHDNHLTPLTAGEERVACLAAAGKTNDQIARELFVARRTVEVHLTSIYRKLDIRGRVELPGALDALAERAPHHDGAGDRAPNRWETPAATAPDAVGHTPPEPPDGGAEPVPTRTARPALTASHPSWRRTVGGG